MSQTQQHALTEALPLSPTRQLRRIHLALRGTEPTLEEYKAITSLSGAQLQSKLDGEIDVFEAHNFEH